MKHLPNFITSLNLTSGFIAVVFILNGDPATASWLLLLAMVFDFLDGFVARAIHAYSEIGKELDSLADVVSFGVAPGLIVYHMLNNAFQNNSLIPFQSASVLSIILLIVPAFMAVCAALRLAIFNLDTTQSYSFKGLPTPANALAVITLVLGDHYSGSGLLNTITHSPLSLIILSVTLSILMVTRIPLLSLKFKSLKFSGNEGRYILIVLCAAMVSVFGIATIPLIIPVYILVSLLTTLILAG